MSDLNKLDEGIISSLIDAISKIETYLGKHSSHTSLVEDNKSYDAVLMNLIVIGELVSKLSLDVKKNHRDIPWSKIKNLRNIIAHNYFGVDPEEVWQIAINEIPLFKSKLNLILHD